MTSFWTNLKVPFFTIFFIFLFLFLYTKLAGPLPLYINSIATTKTDTFQVDGVGKATAIPDTATISFAVTKEASTVADAQDGTNTVMQHILDSLNGLGIDAKNIKTTDYSVEPNYNSGAGTPSITGYTVTQSVDVKVTPLQLVNKTLDALTTNGANVVGQVQFGFSDATQQKLEDQARQEAVVHAKQKAQSLASAAGIHLGQIINVTENSADLPRPVAMLQAVGKGIGDSQPTQVTPGQNTISTTVTLSYQTY